MFSFHKSLIADFGRIKTYIHKALEFLTWERHKFAQSINQSTICKTYSTTYD